MRAYNNVISRIDKALYELFAIPVQKSVLAPGGCQKDGGNVVVFSLVSLSALVHLVHVRDAGHNGLLGGEMAHLLERSYLIFLELARDEDRIVIIDTVNAVHRNVSGAVQDVDVPVDIL